MEYNITIYIFILRDFVLYRALVVFVYARFQFETIKTFYCCSLVFGRIQAISVLSRPLARIINHYHSETTEYILRVNAI